MYNNEIINYFIQVMGPSYNEPFGGPRERFFLSGYGDHVTLKAQGYLPAQKKFVPDLTDNEKWCPIALVTENYDGFVLQNVATKKILWPNGKGNIVTMKSIDQLPGNPVTWAFVKPTTGLFKRLQFQQESTLYLNVKGSDYKSPEIILWPSDNDYGHRNEIWRFGFFPPSDQPEGGY